MRSVRLKFFFNNLHFPVLDSSTIAQIKAVQEIGEIDAAAIMTKVKSFGSKRNSTYTKWSDKDRYLIGKCGSENGVGAAVGNSKENFQI